MDSPKYRWTQRFYPVGRWAPGEEGIIGADKLPLKRKGKSQVIFFPRNVKPDNTILDKRQVVLRLPLFQDLMFVGVFLADQMGRKYPPVFVRQLDTLFKKLPYSFHWTKGFYHIIRIPYNPVISITNLTPGAPGNRKYCIFSTS